MMKKLLSTLFILISCLSYSYGQFRAQFINNSPDVTINSLDIYVNGILQVNDLNFRFSSPLSNISVLPTSPVNIGVAASNSLSITDTFYSVTFSFSLTNEYAIVASGVESTTGYTPSKPFKLEVSNQAKTTAGNLSNTDILFFNGVTDGPTVDLRSGITLLANDVPYGMFSAGYAGIPGIDSKVRLTNTIGDNTIRTYNAPFPLLNLTGKAAIILASGFVTPANNSNGAPYGLWIATTNGGPLIELTTATPESIARVQFIHNGADTTADTIDVYVNNEKIFDDFRFRNASPFMDVFAKVPLSVVVAPGNSATAADGFYTQSITFDSGARHVVVANGIQSASGYTPKPAFTLHSTNIARESASIATNTDILFLNGTTDLPTATISTGTPLFTNVNYGSFSSSYQSLTSSVTHILMLSGAINSSYTLDLNTLGLQGQAITLLTSGFVDTTAKNSKGPLAGLYFAKAAGGPLVKLPLFFIGISSVSKQLEFSVWPNPSTDKIYIATPGNEHINACIFDMTGKKVLSIAKLTSKSIDISQLSPGMYMLQIASGNNTGYTTFVKE